MVKKLKMSREEAERRLGDVPWEKQFYCNDGRVLKNLAELEVAFRETSDDIFRNHFNEEKNDFYNWVAEVIGDDKLSLDLLRIKNKDQAANKVAERIAWLKNILVT